MKHDPDRDRGLRAGAEARAAGASAFEAALEAIKTAFDNVAAERSRQRRLREKAERWRLVALRYRNQGDLAMARAHEAAANALEFELVS